MEDGYTSRNGLGLGLPGSQRIMDEFQIHSVVGQGTTIVMKKWKR
jgi:serine/threonine-protein kinase RsbT